MSRIDLHPEDLKDLQQEGMLTEREEQVLEEHLEHCSACTLEGALCDDFATELEASPEDDEVVERVLNRVIPAQRHRSPKRRPFALAWIAAAAAVLLVTVGASATVWTVVSGFIESRRSIATSQEPDQRPEPARNSPARRPRPVDAVTPSTSTEEPANEEPLEQPEQIVEPADTQGARPRSTGGAREPSPTASELFARANEARQNRRNAEAVQLFRELGRTYPGSREEIASRVSLGRLLLDRLNNPRGALRLFENYLAAAPSGTLAQEARVGRALSLRRLGRTQEEARAWQTILVRHPTSIHSRRARHRLEELGYPSPDESLDQ